MADPSSPPPSGSPATGNPPAPAKTTDVVSQKFPELVALIKGSESMNDEERQYWMNILPIMTPEQLASLKDILDNEKKQLKAIDEKYSHEMEKLGQTEFIRKAEEERQAKRQNRQSAEQAHKAEEERKAENILQEIEHTDGQQ